MSRSGIHLRAISTILRLREPLSRVAAGGDRLAFERFCIEGFLYQTANSILFDADLCSASDANHFVAKYHSCFDSNSASISDGGRSDNTFSPSPLLGTPPEVFLMLIQAIYLAQNDQLLQLPVLDLAWQQYQSLTGWEELIDGGVWVECSASSGRLYAHATRLLILKCFEKRLGRLTEVQKLEARKTLSQAVGLLRLQNLRLPFGKYYLLPLAVIGAVVTEEAEKILIREKIDLVAQRNKSCLVILVKDSLERIWSTTNGFDSDINFNMDGLSLFLDKAQLNKIAALFWPRDSSNFEAQHLWVPSNPLSLRSSENGSIHLHPEW